ncbi:hemolysin family protein [Phosphitispora fastidiosa]|uniref:hemolysin family protein n=1 Tax=Phosphitispora fastidiosa TaxID=2837202 RepID=UPI001E5F886B|nr:hemolysin family protein [Phosphitispora fastidiosa]MBU7006982.1 putative hemolysin [Phosphitispora fastidiosa]
MAELWSEFLIIFILILINAFFAGSEIALVTFRRSRVRQLAKQGSKSAMAVEYLLKDPSRLLATIQVGVTLAGFMASAAAAVSISGVLADFISKIPALEKYAQLTAVIIVTIIISYFTLVLGELVPKRMAMQKAERISLVIAQPIVILAKAAGPFIAFLTASTNLVVRMLGGEVKHREQKLNEEEIRLMVSEQGALDEGEKELIEGIFEFGDTVAKEVMIPRTEIASLECSLTVNTALEEIIRHGFSRYPVFEDNIDNITGITTIKDLLKAVKRGHGEMQVREIKRETHFIPESKNVAELLKELQKRRMNMAVVLDEYGGTAGIVTVEDLLEEIVGDIDDEYNEHKDEVKRVEIISPNHGIFDGRVRVEEVNENLSLDLPLEDTYETIGGLVFHQLGNKPQAGDGVCVDCASIKVMQMQGNRVKRVEVVKENNPGNSPGEEEITE